MVQSRMEARVEELEKGGDTMKDQLKKVDQRVGGLEAKVIHMDETLQEVRDTLTELIGAIGEDGRKGKRTLDPEASHNQEQPPIIIERGGGSRGRREEFHEVERRDNRDNRPRKLDLPLFSVDDPAGWIFRAERYFLVNGVPGDEKLDVTAICLESDALYCFQWREKRKPFLSWADFLKAMRKRFKKVQGGTPHHELFGLKQEETIAAYRAKFELLSTPLDDLSEYSLLGIFINGLKEEIREKLTMEGPVEFEQAYAVAQKVEERLGARNKIIDLRLGRSRFSPPTRAHYNPSPISSREDLSMGFNHTSGISQSGNNEP